MEKIKRTVTAIALVMALGYSTSFAQHNLPDSVLTDTLPAYDASLQTASLNKARLFPYPKINTANVRLYAKTWRDIDLTDTANKILTIPGNSLMETIMKSLKIGKLTPYEKDDFKKRLTAKQGELRFADSVLVPLFDADGNQISSKMTLNEFNPDKITRIRIMEDVFFDKQRGKIDIRIVGLAPLMSITASAELVGTAAFTPAFWLYFPQLRYTLIQQDVSDPDREVFDVTMDDIFMQHKFSAYLVGYRSPGGTQTGQLDAGSEEARLLELKIKELKTNIWQNPRGIDPKLAQKIEDKKENKP